jgi:hypothetical protein
MKTAVQATEILAAAARQEAATAIPAEQPMEVLAAGKVQQ